MALLEIERKFAFKRALLSQFRQNKGNPPFQRLQYLGNTKIHDVYYDLRINDGTRKKDILTSHGIYVRCRNDLWQAKQRIPAPSLSNNEDLYRRTVFKELSCPKDIHALLTEYIPSPPLTADDTVNFGLSSIIDFTTFREKYLVDDRFEVVLDDTCFGHRVGEIEVLAEQGKERQAQREIDGFRDLYSWFFAPRLQGLDTEVPVKGKLSAYFERFPVR